MYSTNIYGFIHMKPQPQNFFFFFTDSPVHVTGAWIRVRVGLEKKMEL